QNLALVNGKDITFEDNRFEDPGQPGGPGSTVIDIEPNTPGDRIENVVIRNNVIDARNNKIQAGNGIVVQSGAGTKLVGPILVEGNTIYGGNNVGKITNSLAVGIYAFGRTMKDVTIRNNIVTRTGQSGLRIQGTHVTITDNKFTDVGGGGIAGFFVAVRDSLIENNSFKYTGSGPASAVVQTATPFGINNTIRNNPGMVFPAPAPQGQGRKQ
ncbi:MAG TPA: right-handed parallel beta-helix repeat-containing protein, partial [Pyrinomonadaceae bacterium]|nr:right-handed parallel beta-helix repeat-containing protein [Pyrinomonadaceae bacterium]